jgi:hypothetical protein
MVPLKETHMRRTFRRTSLCALTLAALLTLPSCSGSQPEQSDGGITPGEAQALNDAAEMLDQSEAEGSIAKGQ